MKGIQVQGGLTAQGVWGLFYTWHILILESDRPYGIFQFISTHSTLFASPFTRLCALESGAELIALDRA